MSDPEQGPEGHSPRWFPSNRKMAFDWYLTRAIRVSGITVVLWEVFADRGHDLPVAMLGTMLATSLDAIGALRTLLSQARFEPRSLEDLIAEERRREAEGP